MIKLKNKQNMIDPACQVGRSLTGLRTTGPRIVVARPGENREEAEDNSRIDFAVTGIFLYRSKDGEFTYDRPVLCVTNAAFGATR